MKRFTPYKLLVSVLFFLASFATTAHAVSTFIVPQGGTGANSFNKNAVIFNTNNIAGPLSSNSSFKYNPDGYFEVGFTDGLAVIQALPAGDAYLGKSAETNILVSNTGTEVDINAYRSVLSSVPNCTTTCTIDDLTLGSGVYTGPNGVNFSVTVTYNHGYGLQFTGETGGSFAPGDTITQTDCAGAGTNGTLAQINGGLILILGNVTNVGSGFDGTGCHLSNGTGVTADEGNIVDSDHDIYDWTDSNGGGQQNNLMSSSPVGLSYGVDIYWGVTTEGHDIGSNWTWVYTVTYFSMLQANGTTGIISMGDPTTSINGTRITSDILNKRTVVNNKFGTAHGSNVASATELVLPDDGNYFHVTGTTGIKHITTGTWVDGMRVILYFRGGLTLTNDDTSGGTGELPMELAGSGDAITVAGTRMEFVLDTSLGSQGEWLEISRTYP